MSSVAENLEGETLPGRRSGRQWKVEKVVKLPLDSSHPNFSVGYEVSCGEQKAFMKATDLSLLTEESGSFFERAVIAMQSHQFERDILEHCRGNSMDRVVVAIDWGDLTIVHEGVREPLFYLIFELAKHDLRRQTDIERRFALAWSLGALHEIALGIQQLHKGNVAHNDIKPANILVFSQDAQKISDLGCATSPLFSAVHQDRHCAGDDKYAAPEVLYATSDIEKSGLCTFSSRRSADLYNLGSMIYFMVTGCMLTPQVVQALVKEHRPPIHRGGWNGEFNDILPYWREAFGRAMDRFKEQLLSISPPNSSKLTDELVSIVFQLCEPDPTIRGHPSNRAGMGDRYGLERYIAYFDRIKRQIQVLS